MSAKKQYSLGQVSYALFYKDSKSKMHMEVVTSIPDANFLALEDQTKENFSGVVTIRDWEGKKIREYTYQKNNPTLSTSTDITANSMLSAQSCTTICAGPFDEDTEGTEVCTTTCSGGDGGPSGGSGDQNGDPHDNDGGGGSSGGGSSGDDTGDSPGSDDEVETPTEPKPCSTAMQLSNNTLKSKIYNLQTTLSSNTEKGFYFRKSGSTYTNVDVTGQPGEASIDFSLTAPIDGLVHTHYNGTLKLFSPKDIATLGQLYKNGRITNAEEFLYGLVTSQGVYTLAVTNMYQFNAWANGIDETTENAIQSLYKNVYHIEASTNETTSLFNLTLLLNAMNTGLSIVKASNANLAAWNTYAVPPNNGNNVAISPCN